MSPFYHTYSDEDLLALLAQSDEGALAEIFARYRDRIYAYVWKHTKSAEITEEIVSDIFMKLWAGRELAPSIRQLSAFLHKVSYYKAMDFLKTVARHERLFQNYVAMAGERLERPVDEVVIDAEGRAILERAILQLPPQRQRIYRLSREEGLTHEEIAQALNLSRSTVNNHLVSAHKSIADYLRKNGHLSSALFLFFVS